jgi:gas vesicle protein
MEHYKRQLFSKGEELKGKLTEKLTEEFKDKSDHVKEKIKDVQDIGNEGKNHIYLQDHCPPKQLLLILQAKGVFQNNLPST